MKLEDLIKQTFSLEKTKKLTGKMGPGNLEGWDSLGHINLMSILESEYKISLDISEIVSLESISDIKKILKKKGVSDFE